MRLTDAQRKAIRKLESMSNEAADQWVGEPSYLDLLTISPMGGDPVKIEFCTGWVTHEAVIHPDGRLEIENERLA